MKGLFRRFWQEEEAQGTTEYILIVLVVVGLAIAFREKIESAVKGQLDKLTSDIGTFGG